MDYCILLGTAQDAGVPQIGCDCENCAAARKYLALKRRVAALGIVLEDERKIFLVDATPDFVSQADELRLRMPARKSANSLDGIFITHLHIGHCFGLIYLGRESAHADALPVYASSKNCEFLKINKPFAHLVNRGEIKLVEMGKEAIPLGGGVSVRTLRVKHRHEDGDTCGFVISGRKRKIAYLPDLDEWDEVSDAAVRGADVAILDGTFAAAAEIPKRADAKVAHPAMDETRRRFADAKTEIVFTHFNHTNPNAAGPEKGDVIFEL